MTEPAAPTPAYDYGAGPSPYAPGAGQPAANIDLLAALLQSLGQQQIPPLPGSPLAPTTAPAVSPPNALSLLSMILSNPQLHQALQQAAVMGSAAPRSVPLTMPAPALPHMRSLRLPLGAVVNTILRLAGEAMTELNEQTSEADPEVPEYLVSEAGDFIVDPTSPDDRAALVAHLFRIDDEARRVGALWQAESSDSAGELDESDEWAREAGFMR
jgi:hypothetical protein